MDNEKMEKVINGNITRLAYELDKLLSKKDIVGIDVLVPPDEKPECTVHSIHTDYFFHSEERSGKVSIYARKDTPEYRELMKIRGSEVEEDTNVLSVNNPVVVNTTNVMTIAWIFNRGLMDMGIIGIDTTLEEGNILTYDSEFFEHIETEGDVWIQPLENTPEYVGIINKCLTGSSYIKKYMKPPKTDKVENATVSQMAWMMDSILKLKDIAGLTVIGTGSPDEPYLTNKLFYNVDHFIATDRGNGVVIEISPDSSLYNDVVRYGSMNLDGRGETVTTSQDTFVTLDAIRLNKLLLSNGNKGIELSYNEEYFEVKNGSLIVKETK